MARQFEKKEANTLIDEHNKILDQSSSLQIELQTFCDNVRKNSDFLVAQSVMKILQEVPIEEINREKRSFRIKALREHGYGTIAGEWD